MTLHRVALRPLCRLCVGSGLSFSRSLSTTAYLARNPQSSSHNKGKPKPRHGFNVKLRDRNNSDDNTLSRVPSRYRVTPSGKKPPLKVKPERLPRMIVGRLERFVGAERVYERLATFGFSQEEAEEALSAWNDKVRAELDPWTADNETSVAKLGTLGWDAPSLILAYEAGEHGQVFESALLRHFITFASENGPEHLKLHLLCLLRATDLSNIAQEHEPARTINRNFHLHMGPTNSGKTYNALKALSRAGTGVYAGPLRLLAHEVWERLNLGSVGDLGGKGRACNLLTGEERRIVDADAGLVSCTVEMLPIDGRHGEPWDVVVVDEIQMLGDRQRGGAWATAVMGVNAKDIHLCGDDTTAALLKSMIDSYKGDTLTIHRYDRLTPLTVSDTSLEGNWNNVKPGDCVVTFSRSNVFAVKKAIEGSLGTRCAVVYGALPPETRAEQAREFNENNGRAEVLVASDAVGMGLNLKIGRIIFESLTKFDGKKEVPLSLSQVKQIAGRAGRFGQQRADSTTDEAPAAGGAVTTLHGADLPLLRAMLPLPLPPLTRASLEIPFGRLVALAPHLPATSTYSDLMDNFIALSKLPPNTVLVEANKYSKVADLVEPFHNVFTLAEVDAFAHAPLNVRDPKLADIFGCILKAYADNYFVDIDAALESSELLETLDKVEDALASLPPTTKGGNLFPAPPITITAIPQLETLHKALVLYIWLSFRMELGFPDRERAVDVKGRTEKVLETCLERLPGLRKKKRRTRTEEDMAQSDGERPKIEWADNERARRNAMRWQNVARLVDGEQQH